MTHKTQTTLFGFPVPHHVSPVTASGATAYAEKSIDYKYEKDFVLWPRKLHTGKWVWLTTVYKKYQVFNYEKMPDVAYFICCMTEEDAVVDKLKNM